MHTMSIRRRSVHLTEPQMAFLMQEAERLGISVSELLRRIIDQYREGKDQTP